MNRAPFRESKILIVDDDPSNVMLVERLLAEAGYTNLRSTTDARRAVPHCAEFRPDLIVLDLVMQHMDGIHLLRELRLGREGPLRWNPRARAACLRC